MLAEFSWKSLMDNLPAILFITFIFGGWVIVAVVRSFTDSCARSAKPSRRPRSSNRWWKKACRPAISSGC